jgi:transcription elongation factor Elf1
MSTSRTCVYCGKEYKSKTNLDKHYVLCEITHRKDKKRTEREEIEDELPSRKQMYKIILDLTVKYNELQEKVDIMSKYVDVKKKKINIIEWLNTSMAPEEIFDKSFAQRIGIIEADVECIINKGNTFYDALQLLFDRTIYISSLQPMFALSQKANCIYIRTESGWEELSREKLIYFLNIVHFNFVKSLSAWNKKNMETKSTTENELLADVYSHATIKLMGVDFKKESILNKIKTSIYENIKKDMKSLIQHEFEF